MARIIFVTILLTLACQRQSKPKLSQLKFGILSQFEESVNLACKDIKDPAALGHCISQATRDELNKLPTIGPIRGRRPRISPQVREKILGFTEVYAPELTDQLQRLKPNEVDQILEVFTAALNKHPNPDNHGRVERQTLFRLDSRGPDQWNGQTYTSPNPQKELDGDPLPISHLTRGGSSVWISSSGSKPLNPNIKGMGNLPESERVDLARVLNLLMFSDEYFQPAPSLCFVNMGGSGQPQLRLCDSPRQDGLDYYKVYVSYQYSARNVLAFTPEAIVVPGDVESLVLTFQPNSYRTIVGTSYFISGRNQWTKSVLGQEREIIYDFDDSQTLAVAISHQDKFITSVSNNALGRWDANLGRPKPFHLVAAAILCGQRFSDPRCCGDFVSKIEKLKLD